MRKSTRIAEIKEANIRQYREACQQAVLKPEGHVQRPLPEEYAAENIQRLYTVTTIAESLSYGGERTVGVFSWEHAHGVVEENSFGIFETSYHLVVVEAIGVDLLYGGLGLTSERYWYLWTYNENHKN